MDKNPLTSKTIISGILLIISTIAFIGKFIDMATFQSLIALFGSLGLISLRMATK